VVQHIAGKGKGKPSLPKQNRTIASGGLRGCIANPEICMVQLRYGAIC